MPPISSARLRSDGPRQRSNRILPRYQIQTKEQYIAATTKGPARYESFTFSDMKIRFYGKAAVLTAYCDVKMTGQDSFRVRTLQVYTETNGQWQMAAHQSTRVAR